MNIASDRDHLVTSTSVAKLAERWTIMISMLLAYAYHKTYTLCALDK